MRVFVDANVVMDLLADREPYADDATAIFKSFHSGRAEGFVSALTFAHVSYLLKKIVEPKEVYPALQEMRRFVEPVQVDAKMIDRALSANGGDFEDEVQVACAEMTKMDCIVTRDGKDFKGSGIPVYAPKELLKKLRLPTFG